MVNKNTIKEILKDMDSRLKHIEDITADQRSVIVKLVKQSNQIVHFLKDIEIEPYDDFSEFEDIPTLTKEEENKLSRFKHIKEILDEYIDKHSELKEFEEELKKHKKEITPGQVGES